MQAKRSEPKRQRAWEKRNPLRSHRIPKALQPEAQMIREAVDGLAEQYMTTHSDIATALMQFALSELRAVHLHFEARPNPDGRKMKIVWSVKDGWPQEIPQPKKKQRAPIIEQKDMFLGYRWGRDLDIQIAAEARSDGVTCGEVLVRLMQYALHAYRDGKLRLTEAAVVVKQQVSATWS
jgi:hypothetical protein